MSDAVKKSNPGLNAFDPTQAQLTPQEQAMIARRQKLLGPGYRLSYAQPLHIVKGQDVWLYDSQGNKYLDAYNNVPCVGHCHPRVISALTQQAAELNIHTRYLHDGILDYAERLLGTFPDEIGHAMFTCTGSEANDLAYRIAQYVTGGTGFIITDYAYHGGTKVISELTPSLGEGTMTNSHVLRIPAPDSYRIPADQLGRAFADGVRKAIAEMKARGIKPAALIFDTAFASDGVYTDPAGFIAEAVQEIRAAGGIFIADEVQAGFGRLGTHMWGFARHNVVPDIVTMGKSMGAGHPMAGIAVKPELVAEFGVACRYFNTFGGNPVSAAVGLAVLDVIEDEGLMHSAVSSGDYLRAGLRDLAKLYPVIGDVRGSGHFTGVDIVSDLDAKTPDGNTATDIINGMRERRVLISASGKPGHILKIRPPLTFGREHADIFIETLEDVLKQAKG